MFSLTIADVREVKQILTMMLDSEIDGNSTVDIALIAETRFDKLLSALSSIKRRIQEVYPRIAFITAMSRCLERMWHKRFQDAYFAIDVGRYKALKRKGGALQDLLPTDCPIVGENMWHLTQIQPRQENPLKLGR